MTNRNYVLEFGNIGLTGVPLTDSDSAPLLHSAHLIEENYYCMVMCDWKATAKVLQDNETFVSHFGPILTPPCLLYLSHTGNQDSISGI